MRVSCGPNYIPTTTTTTQTTTSTPAPTEDDDNNNEALDMDLFQETDDLESMFDFGEGFGEDVGDGTEENDVDSDEFSEGKEGLAGNGSTEEKMNPTAESTTEINPLSKLCDNYTKITEVNLSASIVISVHKAPH